MQIETERLIIRDIAPEQDFEPFCELLSDPRTMKALKSEPMIPEQVWRKIATLLGHHQIRGYSLYSVIEKSTGAWVGRVGHWTPMASLPRRLAGPHIPIM